VSKIRLVLSVFFLLLAGFSVAGAAQSTGALWAVSDGQGTVSLFWIPKDLVWPAGGWRLERVAGGKSQVLAKKIGPGLDRAAMDRLSPADRTAIGKFGSELKSGAIPREDRELASTVMGINAAFDPDFGLALGLRFQDSDPQGGKCSYRLTALNGRGKAQSELVSAAVDPGAATPLPEAAQSLIAASTEAGVELTWDNPKQNRVVPVFAFLVEREDAAGGKVLLTGKPLLIAEAGEGDLDGRFMDLAPPKESEATYRIFSIDFFGRRSRPRSASLFIADVSALAPPGGFTATAGKNRVDLSWELNPSPYTSGYVIERSLLRGGPYVPLTPDGLDADRTEWEDRNLSGGTAYFYRIRSMDPRGELGPASLTATAVPQNSQAPPAPANLRAEVGRTRVRLTWDAVAFPVAGYQVERLAKDARRWILLTSRPVPEPRFDDHVGLHTQGEFRYRVSAVAFDDQQSRPSREVRAILLDTVSPNPPRITAIDGSDGKVVVSFKASAPEEDVHSFLVVRSVAEDDPGLVIGDPLPASKSRFEDTFVAVGQKYWYRLVALDKSGNRSDLSWARPVTVLNPPVPAPTKPSLEIEREPLRHVRIAFKAPPEGLEVIIQRFEEGKGWRPLIGGIRNATEAADLNPPLQPKVLYRLIYRAANGVAGKPSPEAEATLE
jgi:hypothetical protein